MPRVLIAATALVAVLAGIGGYVAYSFVTEEPPPPPQPATVPSVGPSGQKPPFKFVIPTIPADVGEPTFYGPYRLVPYGYGKALPHTPPPAEGPTDVSFIDNPTIIRSSSLFREPSYLPPGYALVDIAGVGKGDAEISVSLRYEGPGFPIEVRISKILERPIDIYLPPDSGTEYIVETGTIAGAPAILEYPAPGTKYQLPVSISFVRDDVEIAVSGREIELDTIVRIAESVP